MIIINLYNVMNNPLPVLNQIDTDRVVEMAWEDRTPFDAITAQFGITEQQVITLMRREMKLVQLQNVAKKGTGPRNKAPW